MDYAEKGERTKIRRIHNDSNGGGREGGNSNDRLSTLPDPILADILSLLPLATAVCSAVLSRRWRCIWHQLTAIRHCRLSVPDFFAFAYPKLIYPSDIVVVEFHDSSLPVLPAVADFEGWISQVCRRRPLESIELDFGNCRSSRLLTLPSCLIQCQTLKTLILGRGLRFVLLGKSKIRLPNLRKFHIFLRHDNLLLMQKLVKYCPLLEDLWVFGKSVDDHGLYIDIACKSLKKLCLSTMSRKPFIFRIDVPKLEYFQVEGNPNLSKCYFAKTPRFLVKAKLFRGFESVQAPWTWQFLRSFERVKFLSFPCEMLPPLCYSNLISGTVFYFLTKLKVELRFADCWRPLMRFLLNCISLKVLVIMRVGRFDWGDMEWSQLSCRLPTCLWTQVKRIKIQNLRGEKNELGLVSFFLSTAKVLETLDVNVADSENEGIELGFCWELFMFPRSSPTCQIDFSGKYIDLSSKDMKIKDLDGQLGRIRCST